MAALAQGGKLPFLVLTDHRNQEYLNTEKRLNHWQARWALFFTCFPLMVTYHPGSKKNKADALSHQFKSTYQPLSPDPIIPSTPILAPVQWDITIEIADAQRMESSPAECPPDKTYVLFLCKNKFCCTFTICLAPVIQELLHPSNSLLISSGGSHFRLIPSVICYILHAITCMLTPTSTHPLASMVTHHQ